MLPYIAVAIAIAFIFGAAYYLTDSDDEYYAKWEKFRNRYYDGIKDDDSKK